MIAYAFSSDIEITVLEFIKNVQELGEESNSLFCELVIVGNIRDTLGKAGLECFGCRFREINDQDTLQQAVRPKRRLLISSMRTGSCIGSLNSRLLQDWTMTYGVGSD